MKTFQDSVFLNEIVLQSRIAQRAAERLRVANEEFDHIEIWCSIQSILIAGGNVSKVLWPQKKYKSRGERLRNLLNVHNNNVLSNRAFRNHFEHYDERIEDYFKNGRPAVYIDLAMNPSMSTFGFERNNRGYNSFNNTLVFRDEVLDLNAVLSALEEIRHNCKPFVLDIK
jgi:hypothetical protein